MYVSPILKRFNNMCTFTYIIDTVYLVYLYVAKEAFTANRASRGFVPAALSHFECVQTCIPNYMWIALQIGCC